VKRGLISNCGFHIAGYVLFFWHVISFLIYAIASSVCLLLPNFHGRLIDFLDLIFFPSILLCSCVLFFSLGLDFQALFQNERVCLDANLPGFIIQRTTIKNRCHK
jgi:hypothetical protein